MPPTFEHTRHGKHPNSNGTIKNSSAKKILQ